MIGEGRHRDDAARQTDDVHRRIAVRRRPVTQLTQRVPAPAFHGACAGHRAGMPESGGHGDDAARQAADIDGRQPVIRQRAVAQLAIAVPAPAFDTAGARDGAGVQGPCRHRDDSARQADDVTGYGASSAEGRVTRPVADLSVKVVAPAAEPAGAREPTGMAIAGRHLRQPDRQDDERGGAAHRAGRPARGHGAILPAVERRRHARDGQRR